MDLVLFGIQGSGKGTQGKIIAEKYELAVFETGACLRSLAKNDSPLGKKVKKIIESGHLVPNEVVMEIIEDFMRKLPAGKNVLFDGIPRQLEQAVSFDKLMNKLNRKYMGVLIKISLEEAFKRLITRRVCEKCQTAFPSFYSGNNCEKCGGNLITRADDNLASIQTRLKAFEEETMPVINKYLPANKIIEINGEQSIENVTAAVLAKVESYYGTSEK